MRNEIRTRSIESELQQRAQHQPAGHGHEDRHRGVVLSREQEIAHGREGHQAQHRDSAQRLKSRAISCTHGGPHGTAGSAALRKARSSLRSQSAVSPSRTSPAIEMKSQSKAPSKPM